MLSRAAGCECMASSACFLPGRDSFILLLSDSFLLVLENEEKVDQVRSLFNMKKRLTLFV